MPEASLNLGHLKLLKLVKLHLQAFWQNFENANVDELFNIIYHRFAQNLINKFHKKPRLEEMNSLMIIKLSLCYFILTYRGRYLVSLLLEIVTM